MDAITVSSLVAGTLIGYFVKRSLTKRKRADEDDTDDDNGNSQFIIPRPTYYSGTAFDSKVVVGIRTDMKLSMTEQASIYGDGVVKAVCASITNKSPYLSPWLYYGQAKICTKVQSQEMMNDLLEKTKNSEAISVTIQYKDNIAACVVGPAPVDEVDKVTRHLKLM